jgi:SpoVK/Ycf46/Vps4 family AAA+-type ATPase
VSKANNSQLPSHDLIMKRLAQIEKDRKGFGEKSVKIPEVKWADVGGLANAKEDIMQTIMLPIEKPHLFKSKLIFKNFLYRWDGSEIWPLVLRPTRYGKDTAGKSHCHRVPDELYISQGSGTPQYVCW